MQDQAIANRPNGKVNKTLALAYALQGMTYTDIAKEFGVTQGAISQAIADQRDSILAYQAFTKHKDTFLEFEQWKLAELTNDETRKKALTSRGYTDIAILEDKIRLIRGQATEISVNFDALKAMQARQVELAAKMKALESGVIDVDAGPQDVVLLDHDNVSPKDNVLKSLDKTNNEQTDNTCYVNYKGRAGKAQGTRKGRPRKAR